MNLRATVTRILRTHGISTNINEKETFFYDPTGNVRESPCHPVVSRNTATSDFRIQDIMDNNSPVSLYPVLNP